MGEWESGLNGHVFLVQLLGLSKLYYVQNLYAVNFEIVTISWPCIRLRLCKDFPFNCVVYQAMA